MNLHACFDQYRAPAIPAVAERARTRLASLPPCDDDGGRRPAHWAIWLKYIPQGELTAHELHLNRSWTPPAERCEGVAA